MGASGPGYGAGGREKLAQCEAICAISAKKLAQHEVMCAISAKKLAQHAIKHSFWAILPALGECFRAIVIDRLRWANFLAPMPLRSSPVEWCNRFVSFGLGYALSWSGVSSCPVGCGVSRDLVRMSRLR